MNPARSTFSGDPHPKSLTVRFEPHAKGEVFTLEEIDGDGRAFTSSTILNFDSQPHHFEDHSCSGAQSSRRVDNRTVEILRTCASGESTRLVRRLTARPKELVLEITKRLPGGRGVERHLILEKQ